MANYTVPGLDDDKAHKVRTLLQDRLIALLDLQMTLKHIHWNVVGPTFIAVHEMLDPQVDAVRAFADATAERIATLGGEPKGTPGAIVAQRSWEDYSVDRGLAIGHLGALDLVYQGLLADHRRVLEELEALDPISQDMVIGQTAQLELFHWFVRAHLEDAGGNLSTQGATSEQDAVEQATTST